MRNLACCAVLSLSSAASASVLWRGDYETANISQWSGYEGILSRFGVVQSPLRQGSYALRVELRQGDVTSSGTRNEVENGSRPEVEGNDRWFAWSTLFPADFPAPQTWQVFTQWHHSGCCGSPPLEFDAEGEIIQLAHQGDLILWSAPLVRGVWHDFVTHVYFSSSDGFIELWYDGKQALGRTPVQTLNPGEYDYLKQGLYRDASIAPVAVIYHDGMVEGTTMADVAPQLLAPPPGAGTPLDAGPQASDDGGSPSGPVVAAPVSASTIGANGCSTGAGGALALLGLLALMVWQERMRRGPPAA